MKHSESKKLVSFYSKSVNKVQDEYKNYLHKTISPRKVKSRIASEVAVKNEGDLKIFLSKIEGNVQNLIINLERTDNLINTVKNTNRSLFHFKNSSFYGKKYFSKNSIFCEELTEINEKPNKPKNHLNAISNVINQPKMNLFKLDYNLSKEKKIQLDKLKSLSQISKNTFKIEQICQEEVIRIKMKPSYNDIKLSINPLNEEKEFYKKFLIPKDHVTFENPFRNHKKIINHSINLKQLYPNIIQQQNGLAKKSIKNLKFDYRRLFKKLILTNDNENNKSKQIDKIKIKAKRVNYFKSKNPYESFKEEYLNKSYYTKGIKFLKDLYNCDDIKNSIHTRFESIPERHNIIDEI